MREPAMTLSLADAPATETLGAKLVQSLDSSERTPVVVHLRGDLGAGKTTLARGILRALGWTGIVRSPSYTLLEAYEVDPWTCLHVDLYRLNAPEELEQLGLRDYVRADHMLLIEWPEKGGTHTPPPDLAVDLDFEGAHRRARLAAKNARTSTWLERCARADRDSK